MTLLNTLQSKDSIQELFDINSETAKEKEQYSIKSVDVVLCALEFLIPLMNQEMLKVKILIFK